MALLGQTTILEAISAIILLFTAFYFIFKPLSVKDNWQTANLITLGRDILLSLDFTGNLYNASFSDVALKNFIDKTSISKESIFLYIRAEETFKDTIIVAANCTQEKIKRFSEWYGLLVVNKRYINIFFIPTNLTNIPEYSDLLLICGPVNLTDYNTNILQYLSSGKGIIEIANFSSIDPTTQKIFGIKISSSSQPNTDVYINTPSSITSDIYYPYKFFYNIPLVINSTQFDSSSGRFYGNFTFRNYTIPYEIDFTSKKINFMTNTIVSVSERQSFILNGYNFFLSYIPSYSSFSISFKKTYNFTSFRGKNNVVLTDNNDQRIFLYEGSPTSKIPVAVLNSSRAAWIADFDIYNNATHDQKLALLSLILTVSGKKYYYSEPYSVYKIPYLDVENYDIYEVYKSTLGITYPSS
jgi:hypothetical protein